MKEDVELVDAIRDQVDESMFEAKVAAGWWTGGVVERKSCEGVKEQGVC